MLPEQMEERPWSPQPRLAAADVSNTWNRVFVGPILQPATGGRPPSHPSLIYSQPFKVMFVMGGGGAAAC